MLLLKQNAKIIGQGITGFEGSQAALWMKKYGTNLVAGVTPGKGGQTVEGIPIFNSVKEAVKELGEFDGTVQYVPPLFTKDAVIEAIEAGVKFILIVAEKVATKDGSFIYALAKEKGVVVVGPSSAGLINPSLKLKLGSIGGPDPDRCFVPGNIAVISKSGGMTSECSLLLKNNGMGVSWAVCIGGDRIPGTDFVGFLQELENDPQTRASVIFGELGGTYEEKVAQEVKRGSFKKPVIAYIAGDFTLTLPSDIQFGHAGAIIEGDRGKPDYKRQILRESGVKVAEEFDEIAILVKESLKLSS